MEEKGSSGPEISMGVAEEKPKASEDIGEMKYEEYLCKLETAAKGGMLDGEYNKEKQNLDYIGKHIAKTEEIRLKTQASRQALERAYLEIKAVYGDSANKSRGKGEPGHGKSSSLTKICPKCGRTYPEKYKFCIRKKCFTDKKGTRLIYRAKCSSCGSDLIEYEGKGEIKYCPECGKGLPEKQAAAINKGFEKKEKESWEDESERYCDICGKTYSDGEEVCPECGIMLLDLKCGCGTEYIKKESGEYNKYCPACGKHTLFGKIAEEEAEKKRKQGEEERRKKEAEEAARRKREEEEKARQEAERRQKEAEKKAKSHKIGDKITFGSYPFYEDGRKKAIDWIILDIDAKGNALLISDYCLDNVRYNEQYADITWEDSSIRKWLNNDFLNKAFTDEQQSKIIKGQIANNNNAEYRTRGGNATNDKLFLLSIEEAEKYFRDIESRIAYPTPYAKSKKSVNGNLYVSSSYVSTDRGGSCWWWLRSPGFDQDCAANVRSDGIVDSRGYSVRNVIGAVRVAFKINLNNL